MPPSFMAFRAYEIGGDLELRTGKNADFGSKMRFRRYDLRVVNRHQTCLKGPNASMESRSMSIRSGRILGTRIAEQSAGRPFTF